MTNVTVSETNYNVSIAETNQNVTTTQTGAINVSVNATDLVTTLTHVGSQGSEIIKSLANNTLTVKKLKGQTGGTTNGIFVNEVGSEEELTIGLLDTCTIPTLNTTNLTATNIAGANITGDLIPSTDDAIDLGSTTKRWRDLYLGPGSLFINNQKVLEDDSGTIKISTDNGQNLNVQAGGTITMLSSGAVTTIQDTTVNLGPSVGGGAVALRGNDMSGIGTATATKFTAGTQEYTSGKIEQTASGNNIEIKTPTNGFIVANTGDFYVGNGDTSSDEFIKIDENTITKVNGGTLTLTGNVTGQVSDISNHLLDEDNFATDSATKAPSQQSVKAYIATQIATKDNTDEITEGSSNLYFTDARARAAISEGSTQLAYNSSTGVLTYTQGDTDTVSEGSSNLYFTTARARASISASGSLAYNSSTGALTYTQGDTDTVSEGSSNLYFTNSRADARITAASLFDLSDVTGSHGAGKLLVNTGSAFSATTVNTDNFSEGSSNLFHTSARAIAAVEAEATLDLTGTVTVTGSAATKNTTIGDATVGGSFAQHGFTINAGDTCWSGVNLRETTGGASKPINNFSNPTFGATVFGGTEASKTGVESGKRLVVIQGLASQDGSEPTSANARFMFETTQQQSGSARGSVFKLETCPDDSTSTVTSLSAQGGVITLNPDGDATLKSGGDLQIDDNVEITGTLDAQGAISNSTGDVTVNDNLKVNTNLTVDGNTQLGNANTDTITATGKLTTQNGLVLTSLNVSTANTLAGLGVIDEGSIIYCTDGDSGSKCIAIYDGSNWKRISLGANISSS